jgi:hypothetical protein
MYIIIKDNQKLNSYTTIEEASQVIEQLKEETPNSEFCIEVTEN